MKFLIPHNFAYTKYYPDVSELPYEATGRYLYDEIKKLDPPMDCHLARDESDFHRLLPEANAIVTYRLSRSEFDTATNLQWVQAGHAGIDHFFKISDPDMNDLDARSVQFTKAAGVTRIVIGEHVFSLLLAASRRLDVAMQQKSERRWNIFMANEIAGRTIAIVGLGEIGRRVAFLAKAFGMNTIGVARRLPQTMEHLDQTMLFKDLDDVLPAADYIVLCCALNDETRGRFNSNAFQRMKSNAVLINVARGELIIEDDLANALTRGDIAVACLDVFAQPRPHIENAELEKLAPTSPLWTAPNVIMTPNNASASPRVYSYLAEIIVDNARRFVKGEPLKFLIESNRGTASC